MVAKVDPPNPVQSFVDLQKEVYKLSPVAFRFLTNIVQALNGQPFIEIGGVSIAQFSFGSVTLSTGALSTPNGLLPGTIGDIFFSTVGAGGNVIFAKNSGTPLSTFGWTAIT